MKTIAHIAMIALKYFFNIDHHICADVVTVILVIVYSLKMLPALVINEFQEGIQTIKEDILDIRATLADLQVADYFHRPTNRLQ